MTPVPCCAICSARRQTCVRDANTAVLTIHVHSMANPRSNRAIHHLLTQLNAAN